MKIKFFLLLVTVCVLANIFSAKVSADAPKNFVLVLDTSTSMKNSDANKIAPEALQALSAYLPKDAVVNFLSFSDTVQTFTQENFASVNYSGYTNTGAALETAVNLLENKSDGAIILLTDGEIMLPSPSDTLKSVEKFQAAMEKASKKNIPVYILELQFKDATTDFHINSTYAKTFSVEDDTKLFSTIRKVAKENLGVKFIELPTQKNSSGEIPTSLPFTADYWKIILLSTKAGNVELKNFPADCHIFNGSCIKVIERSNTDFKDSSLKVEYPDGAEVFIAAVPEVKIDATAEVKEENLLVTPTVGGENFLQSPLFQGKQVTVSVDGEEKVSTVQDANLVLNVDKKNTPKQIDKIFYEDIGIPTQGSEIEIASPEGKNYALIAFGFLAMLGALYYFFSRKKKVDKPEPKSEVDPVPVLNTIPYTGKFVLYFMKLKDDEEIEPLEFNLFRLGQSNVTLQEILKGCGLDDNFKGAEDIFFNAIEKGVSVYNRSSCTITKNNAIILKGASKNLVSDESLYITFADEVTELLLVYKNLKPSDRR